MKQVKVRETAVTSPTDLLILQKSFLFLDDDVIILTRTGIKDGYQPQSSKEKQPMPLVFVIDRRKTASFHAKFSLASLSCVISPSYRLM